jgi:hypothetical protein
MTRPPAECRHDVDCGDLEVVLQHAPRDPLIREELADLARRVGGRVLTVCISGIDGSGETSPARRLAALFRSAGLAVAVERPYRWYRALLVVPWEQAFSRPRVGPRALIIDRCICDNLAILFPRTGGRPGWLLAAVVGVLAWLHPAPDRRIYLDASPEQISERRPGEGFDRLARRVGVYRRAAGDADDVTFKSGPPVPRGAPDDLRRTREGTTAAGVADP